VLTIFAVPLWVVHLDAASAESDFTAVCGFKELVAGVTEDDRNDLGGSTLRACRFLFSHGSVREIYMT